MRHQPQIIAELDPDLSMDEILRMWPATIRVLLRHKVLCLGCPLAVFHTVADACIEHCLDEETFVAELEQAIRESASVAAAAP
jgi:hybrid cluster-associated redox disulfide protein